MIIHVSGSNVFVSPVIDPVIYRSWIHMVLVEELGIHGQ